MTVDVVIPTWNGRRLLEGCLATLARQTTPARLIVVDNGSADGTAEFVERSFPQATLVRLPENRGFAAAVNHGVAAGEADCVVLLNNDVECDPHFLERIAAALPPHGRVGMAAALLLKPGRGEIDSFGLELDATLAAFPRFSGAPYPSTELHDRNLAGPSGGAAAYSRVALAAVGGFDEQLFAYHEDVDVALRLQAAGWACTGAPEAVGVHLGSATIGRRSRFQVETAGASRAYVLRKYGVLRRPAIAARALAVELVVVVIECFVGRDLAALRGRLSGWRRRPTRLPLPQAAVNPGIGFTESLRRRWRSVRG
jgi:N-acetylglucosaminyl-diphospho-decaprenol L-rhamnosyltransferase